MEDSDTEDEKEDSGFSLGGFVRNRFLMRAIFGGSDEEEPAPVIQIDSGSTATEEVEAKDTSQDDSPPEEAAAEEPADEVPAR